RSRKRKSSTESDDSNASITDIPTNDNHDEDFLIPDESVEEMQPAVLSEADVEVDEELPEILAPQDNLTRVEIPESETAPDMGIQEPAGTSPEPQEEVLDSDTLDLEEESRELTEPHEEITESDPMENVTEFIPTMEENRTEHEIDDVSRLHALSEELEVDPIEESAPVSSEEIPKKKKKKQKKAQDMGTGYGQSEPSVFIGQDPSPSKEEKIIKGPIGLDVGTTSFVLAQKRGNDLRTRLELNAFYTIPSSQITMDTFYKNDMMFFEKDSMIYILGDKAEGIADIFNENPRRPIESGLLNPTEKESENILKAMLDKLLNGRQGNGEKICFSIPGEPIGQKEASIVYHESIIKRHLRTLGYNPFSINEGMAVVLSELSSSDFTGMGISLGGGMCNVCFAYLTIPVVTFSIQMGGDYIDRMTARSVGESSTRIKKIKEETLDLSVEPRNRIETGLHIYYDNLFTNLIKSMQKVMGSSDKIPRLSKSTPIVLSGGTAIPKGSLERFKKIFVDYTLPIPVSDIFLAQNPRFATAKGALMMAETSR
ncbi:hypothetical protein ACFLT9_13825, partial [Acidobacteriota bacterium]